MEPVQVLAQEIHENTFAVRNLAAANIELATAITAAAAQLRPTAGMNHAELQELADKQRLSEPPVFDPSTHQGRVEANVRKMLAMEHDTGE